MTSAEVCSVIEQLENGLQAHLSADTCLAICLYNDDVVQAVTFAYLINDEFLIMLSQAMRGGG